MLGTLEGLGCAGYPVKILGYAWFPVEGLGCVGFPVEGLGCAGYLAERLEMWVPGGGAGVCLVTCEGAEVCWVPSGLFGI